MYCQIQHFMTAVFMHHFIVQYNKITYERDKIAFVFLWLTFSLYGKDWMGMCWLFEAAVSFESQTDEDD